MNQRNRQVNLNSLSNTPKNADRPHNITKQNSRQGIHSIVLSLEENTTCTYTKFSFYNDFFFLLLRHSYSYMPALHRKNISLKLKHLFHFLLDNSFPFCVIRTVLLTRPFLFLTSFILLYPSLGQMTEFCPLFV